MGTRIERLLSLLPRDLRRRVLLYAAAVATPERRAAWQLVKRAFLYRKEPSFIAGKNPDFLTFGRGRMWVEVKSLDPAPSDKLLGLAHQELKKRLENLQANCAIDASVAAGFDSSTAKRAVGLLKFELRAGLPAGTKTFIGIPSSALSKGIVTIEWTDDEGSQVRLVAPKSKNNIYGCPLSAQPDWVSNVNIAENGTVRTELAFKVLSVVDPCLLMIRVVPTPKIVGLASVSGAKAENVTTVLRIRRCIDAAAGQLKNAQTFRTVPGVVVIYNDHMIADRQDALLAALGDLTYPLHAAARKTGNPYYGMNGALNQNKNTSVSAITYRSRIFPDISLINPYAAIPIKPSFLTGQVYAVDEDGMVAEV